MFAVTEAAGFSAILAKMSVDVAEQSNLFPPAARRLCVYVSADCLSCSEAVRLAGEIAQRFPRLVTEIINLDEPESQRPDNVFAVPTYVLDGRVLYLGNPYPEQMFAKLAAAFAPPLQPES